MGSDVRPFFLRGDAIRVTLPPSQPLESPAMIPILVALSLQAAAAVPAAATADADKPVCKRTTTTGSYVRGKKVCMTRRQWQRMADDSQELGRNMRPPLTVGP